MLLRKVFIILFRPNGSLLFFISQSEKLDWKSCISNTIWIFFCKLSDTFQQVLCDTKALNETVLWTTYLLTFDQKMKRRHKTATFYWGYYVGLCDFEKQESSRNVRKRCRGCNEVITQNEGSALAAAKARRVKTVRNKCEYKVYFCPSCFKRTHIGV